jgi:hypothetical protein
VSQRKANKATALDPDTGGKLKHARAVIRPTQGRKRLRPWRTSRPASEVTVRQLEDA